MYMRYYPKETLWPLLPDNCISLYFIFTKDDFGDSDNTYKEFIVVVGELIDDCIQNFKDTRVLRIHMALESPKVSVIASSESTKYTEVLQDTLKRFTSILRDEFRHDESRSGSWNKYLREQLTTGGLVVNLCNVLECDEDDMHMPRETAEYIMNFRDSIIKNATK